MNYKTYAEAKIANPDSEIVTTGENWKWAKHAIGTFLACNSGIKRSDNQDGWVICNPADYCSSIKEFLEGGYTFSIGDLFIGISGDVTEVEAIYPQTNKCEDSDGKRYILSAAALNGGCKIPAKAEQWTVYNNTLPLCDLTDEQAAALFNAWRCGGKVQFLSGDKEWKVKGCNSGFYHSDIYRIKPKSERELFIENSSRIMHSVEGDGLINDITIGALYDNGLRYKDLTQHFGENI